MASESVTPPIPSQPQGQPQAQPPSTTTTTTSKTPVTLAPTAHLDPSAYVRGTHPINISPNTLIHPRVHLLSLHSPLTIGENSIISEKTILGGPLPPPPTPADAPSPVPPIPDPSPNPTTIGRHVHIHPNVAVQSGASIGSFAVLEASVTVAHDVSVGRHSKVCAGVTLTNDVPEWTVVYGSDAGQKRRRRRNGNDDGADVTEAERLKAMEREREGTVGILRAAAARAAASRGARR